MKYKKYVPVLVVAIVATLVAFFIAFTMTGCVDKGSSEETNERFIVQGGRRSDTTVAVVTDRKTGVQYLIVNQSYGAAVYPLLNADGTPYIEEN